jgi:hypothetical protein
MSLWGFGVRHATAQWQQCSTHSHTNNTQDNTINLGKNNTIRDSMLFHKRQVFGNKVTGFKMCVLVSYKNLSEMFLIFVSHIWGQL